MRRGEREKGNGKGELCASRGERGRKRSNHWKEGIGSRGRQEKGGIEGDDNLHIIDRLDRLWPIDPPPDHFLRTRRNPTQPSDIRHSISQLAFAS